MPRRVVDVEEIKERMDNVETNLAIYHNDLKRFRKKLKKEFGTAIEKIKDRPVEIEEELEKLEKKRRRLIREIEEGLDGINA